MCLTAAAEPDRCSNCCIKNTRANTMSGLTSHRRCPCCAGKTALQHRISHRRQRKPAFCRRFFRRDHLCQQFPSLSESSGFLQQRLPCSAKRRPPILRDYTSSNVIVWLMNHLEMPLANLVGHGDVKVHKPAEFTAMAEKAGFTVLKMEKQKGFRAHLVARKL